MLRDDSFSYIDIDFQCASSQPRLGSSFFFIKILGIWRLLSKGSNWWGLVYSQFEGVEKFDKLIFGRDFEEELRSSNVKVPACSCGIGFYSKNPRYLKTELIISFC